MAGELFSLSAALAWAFAVILLRRSGESVPPFALNLFRVGVSSVIFVLVLVALDTPLLPERPWSDYVRIVVSALSGIVVSDTLLHRSINLVGAGINAIVDCLYSPFVALAAFALLDESLGLTQLAGMALVISAVIITTHARPPAGATHRDLLAGIGWGVVSMATLALGIVIVKPVLETSSVLWVTAARQIASLGLMLPLAIARRGDTRALAVFRPGPSWRFMLPATLCGSVLSLMLWLAGFKYTLAGIAAILNQTSTIFILVLASLLLGEPFTGRRWSAAALAIGGILLVTLS